MPEDLTQPVPSLGRQPDIRGSIKRRSPADDPGLMANPQRLYAERHGIAHLVFRDGAGRGCVRPLDCERVTLGRGEDRDVTLEWDRGVSRCHATIEHLPDGWIIIDDGRSLNGTMVNGDRIRGRRELHHRDLVQVGETALAFLDPMESG